MNTYALLMRVAPRNPSYLAGSLQSLEESGALSFPRQLPCILSSTTPDASFLVQDRIRERFPFASILLPEREVSGIENAINTLYLASSLDVTHVILCEDDIAFARGWMQYLDEWVRYFMLAEGVWGTLYAPYPQVIDVLPTRAWIYPRDAFYGTQAIIMRRRDAGMIADLISMFYRQPEKFPWQYYEEEHWEDRKVRCFDFWVNECFSYLYPEGVLLATAPSLVQHTGISSTAMQTFHTAPSFQDTAPAWEAPK